MHNTWLIIKREYLERVRSRAFIAFTLLMPLFVAGIVVLPAKLGSMRSASAHHIVIVASDAALGEELKQQIAVSGRDLAGDSDPTGAPSFSVDINLAPSAELRRQLEAQVNEEKLEGFLWVTDETIATRKFTYTTRSSDFMEAVTLRTALRTALSRQTLTTHGLTDAEMNEVLKPIDIETVRIEKGKQTKSSGFAALLLPFLLMMMIYMTLIIYGVSVMRSVLEEKSSRVIEVLLSSITTRQLMAGKILGIGAVGFTQVLIWAGVTGLVGAPTMVAARPYLADVQIPIIVLACFPLFFLLGYLLYSTMYAAIGAMVNSDEEAQQMQWPVLLPLILCTVFALNVMRQPNSPMAFWASMFPLTSPIVMFMRIVVQQPPAWQIALSILILLVTIYGLLSICSRIYRVGILMYGKRPTLPELMKWIKYAG